MCFRGFGACPCILPCQPVLWQAVWICSMLIRFSISKKVIHLMSFEKSLCLCKFPTFKAVISEDTVWISPWEIQGTQGLLWRIPAVCASWLHSWAAVGTLQPCVLVPVLKKHHSEALKLRVSRRVKFMVTGQLVKMALLFHLILCPLKSIPTCHKLKAFMKLSTQIRYCFRLFWYYLGFFGDLVFGKHELPTCRWQE